MTRLLFIVGVGRSGTTALWEVLSAHHQVVLGCERYKYLWGDVGQFTAEHFTDQGRFFDFSDGATNIIPTVGPPWSDRYAEMAGRFDQALYVGDKMTQIKTWQLRRALPEPRFVGIVRRVTPMAASWDVRAKKPAHEDPWPARHDAKAAVEHWNEGVGKLVRNRRRHPEWMQLVEYDAFFSDPDARALVALLDWLGLEVDDGVMAAFEKAHGVYADELAGKPVNLSPEAVAHISRHRDRKLWRQAKRLAL